MYIFLYLKGIINQWSLKQKGSPFKLPIYEGKARRSAFHDITPLSAIKLYLEEQLKLRIAKQNLLRRKRADLPYEKTLEQFDFGFQRSVTKETMLRLADMTWVEQAYNICFLGPPGIGKTHLAVALTVKALDTGSL